MADQQFFKGGFPTRPLTHRFRSSASMYYHHVEPYDTSLFNQFLEWKVEIPVVSIIGLLILFYVLLC